jgi:hypothetical protein
MMMARLKDMRKNWITQLLATVFLDKRKTGCKGRTAVKMDKRKEGRTERWNEWKARMTEVSRDGRMTGRKKRPEEEREEKKKGERYRRLQAL